MNTIQRAQSEPNLSSLGLNNAAPNQTRRHSFSSAIEQLSSTLLQATHTSSRLSRYTGIPRATTETITSQTLARTESGTFALPTELRRNTDVATARHTRIPNQLIPANTPGAYRVPGVAGVTDENSVLTIGSAPNDNNIDASDDHQQLLITNAYLVVDAEPHPSATTETPTEQQLQQPQGMTNDQMDKCCTIL